MLRCFHSPEDEAITLDDKTYLEQFEQRALSPEHFDHVGHLRIAWLYLVHDGLNEGNVRVCCGIRELATKLGAPEKFNHTLTEALMRIMMLRIQGAMLEDFELFLRSDPDLVSDAEAVLARYYSQEHLAPAEARRGWVKPDLEAIK